jgi:RNA polymerase sigma-70 factor (ECF subfamily)
MPHSGYAMHNELTDEQLALQVQQGKQAAFVLLYDHFQPKILQYGRRFLYKYEDVEDAAQEVFIKAYTNIQSYDITRKFSTWIYRVAHNTFIDIIRKKGKEPVSFLDFDTLVSLPVREKKGLEEKIMIKMETEEVQKLVAGLPVKYREVLVLFYYEEKDYMEIAEILHIPTATVGVRLRRARFMVQGKNR